MQCEIADLQGDCQQPAAIVIKEQWVGESPEEVTPMHRCKQHGPAEASEAVGRMISGQVVWVVLNGIGEDQR